MKSMLKLISFGSGSSGNSYFLYTEQEGLLIDCGVGVRTFKKHFREYGLSLSNITDIIITHDHADHIKSVGSLSKELHIPVYASLKVHQGIDQNYCVKCKIQPEQVKIIEKGMPFNVRDFRITPFGVPHDSSENIGYKIQHDNLVFCIMTDIGHVTDEMKAMIGEANYLIIEANHDEDMLQNGPYPGHLKARIAGPYGHLSNRECGTVLAENATAKLKHVWLCHLSDENNHPTLTRKTVEQILRSYGIIPGVDFQMDVLRRKVPSEIYELT